ncbi:hypothetical protein Tco_0930662 [Tanacetum coccineum]
MNNKKHIIGLDQFRDILQICPKVGNKKFEEPPLEKEILAFLSKSLVIQRYKEDHKLTSINSINPGDHLLLTSTNVSVDIQTTEAYKEYYAIASGTIPTKTKGSKKKANTYTITKRKPPTAPKEKKYGKGKQKTTELETISTCGQKDRG